MSDKPKLMKRRSIRKSEIQAICERQGLSIRNWDSFRNKNVRELKVSLSRQGVCDYSGEPINGQPFDFDHKIPNALLYEGDEIVWEVVLRKWHKIKSKADVSDIARAKRRAGETGQYARRKRRGESLIQGRKEIQSRGFRKKGEFKSNTRIEEVYD